MVLWCRQIMKRRCLWEFGHIFEFLELNSLGFHMLVICSNKLLWRPKVWLRFILRLRRNWMIISWNFGYIPVLLLIWSCTFDDVGSLRFSAYLSTGLRLF